MLIGMVLDSDAKTIVPFTEGEIVRVFNSGKDTYEDAPNPALKLEVGKRGAVINWLYNKKVQLICSPPGTLCELSYNNAKEKQMKFYQLQPNTSFSSFKAQLLNGDIPLDNSLNENDVLPSN